MPRTKNFPPKKEKKGKHAAPPETADEYLAAGVDLEEAGEKWRGGDAVKSTRFFIRAIECYDEGLKRFPESFDLAYNEARVQYELTQHPKLLKQLPGTLLESLGTALDSSRFALRLGQDNADVLFNTAQILTSIVEAIADSTDPTNPIPLLEEALSLFQRCLSLQEYQYTESKAQAEAMAAELASQEASQAQETSQPAESSNVEESMEESRWATILEPVTITSLIDTVLASLHTLTLLTNLLPGNTNLSLLPWIQTYSSSLINEKLTSYESVDPTSSSEPTTTALPIFIFHSALATALFKSQPPTPLSIQDYTTTLKSLTISLPPIATPEILIAQAETYITYNESLRVAATILNSLNPSDLLSLRWTALTSALDCLTQATRLPGADNLAAIHLMRGDTEMLRWQLGQGENVHEAARKNGNVLLGNAGKFYRGAGKVAEVDGDGDIQAEAVVKAGIVGLLMGGDERGFLKERDALRVLEEMVDEGVVTIEQVRGLGIE